MEKENDMLRKIRKHAGMLYIVLMTGIVVAVLGYTNEWTRIAQAMEQMRLEWIVAACGCIVGYLLMRVITLRYYLRQRGYGISWRDAMTVTGVGQFYSAITPSASGGQPMQVWALRRRGVPISVGTACVSVKFIGFQVAILLSGGALWLANWKLISRQLYGVRWLVAIGFAINAGLILLVLLTAFCNNALDRLLRWTIRWLAKLRLVKRPAEVCGRLEGALQDYREALLSLLRRPVEAMVILLLSLLQVLLYMSVVLCMYWAFSLSGTNGAAVLTIQYLLFIAAAFIPLPGAAGAQESGFCVFFRGIFPEANLMAAMICWRFFSYYLILLIGFGMMMAGGIRKREISEEEESGDAYDDAEQKAGENVK